MAPYKTRICLTWEREGFCDFPNCKFAHGKKELVQLPHVNSRCTNRREHTSIVPVKPRNQHQNRHNVNGKRKHGDDYDGHSSDHRTYHKRNSDDSSDHHASRKLKYEKSSDRHTYHKRKHDDSERRHTASKGFNYYDEYSDVSPPCSPSHGLTTPKSRGHKNKSISDKFCSGKGNLEAEEGEFEGREREDFKRKRNELSDEEGEIKEEEREDLRNIEEYLKDEEKVSNNGDRNLKDEERDLKDEDKESPQRDQSSFSDSSDSNSDSDSPLGSDCISLLEDKELMDEDQGLKGEEGDLEDGGGLKNEDGELKDDKKGLKVQEAKRKQITVEAMVQSQPSSKCSYPTTNGEGCKNCDAKKDRLNEAEEENRALKMLLRSLYNKHNHVEDQKAKFKSALCRLGSFYSQ